jgi:hypothetical protein
MKDAAERPAQIHGQNFIADGSHLAVAGDDPDPIDGVQILRLLAAPLVKGEQGQVLEREHGKAGHESVSQGDFAVTGAMVGYFVKLLADDGEHGIGVEMGAHFEFAKSFIVVTMFVDETGEGRHNDSPCNILILQEKSRQPLPGLSREKCTTPQNFIVVKTACWNNKAKCPHIKVCETHIPEPMLLQRFKAKRELLAISTK